MSDWHNTFHYGLSQNIEDSYLYYTLGPCLSILNVIVCISHKKNEIMPSTATWMQLEIIILSEVSQKERDYVESKIWHMWTYLQNSNRLVDIILLFDWVSLWSQLRFNRRAKYILWSHIVVMQLGCNAVGSDVWSSVIHMGSLISTHLVAKILNY